jgi:hypothetical protein
MLVSSNIAALCVRPDIGMKPRTGFYFERRGDADPIIQKSINRPSSLLGFEAALAKIAV